jgi:hypothetical protein
MAGCLEVRVGRRLDLLALGADLLEAPVALPAISISYKGCMCGCDTRYAEPARAVVAGAASPLSVEELEGAFAGEDIAVLNAEPGDLGESAVASPALLAGAEMRIRGEVAMGLLGVDGGQAPEGAGEEQESRERGFEGHFIYWGGLRLIRGLRLETRGYRRESGRDITGGKYRKVAKSSNYSCASAD